MLQVADADDALLAQFNAITSKFIDPPDPGWLEVATFIAQHYTPPKTGRPSRLAEPETIARLLTYLARGNYLQTACNMAHIAVQTVRDMLTRGEGGERPFSVFMWAVKQAEAKAETEAVRKVRAAADDPRFWAAEMTFLERKSPDRWGRRQDDTSVAKVVVQIGAKDSDVTVNLGPSLVPRNELAE